MDMKYNGNNLIKILGGTFLLMFAFTLFSCQESKKSYNNNPKDTLANPVELIDKFSYMVGSTMGSNFDRDSLYNVNYDYLVQGIKDALAKKLKFNKEQFDAINDTMQKVLFQKQKNKVMRERKAAEDAKKEAYEFLAKNKLEKDVKTLPSGLQYKVIKEGSGSSPKPGDYITINAVAYPLNGKEISNTYKDKKPIKAQLKEGMLLAWMQSIPLMKIGSKWKIWAPSELAFGERGMNDIPGNKVMIFEIELLDFQIEPYPDMPQE
ncbi:hypothetical protein D9V86_10725 [Bacteroidetes/Chlorobi group bacterium ChocPot_Mid]|nr:MAG: hypothetical protein D9V86_10725 [Bacteroidetes/Chlorobi group bacterium ChocPot_Mid]